jgi:hypothetical protein
LILLREEALKTVPVYVPGDIRISNYLNISYSWDFISRTENPRVGCSIPPLGTIPFPNPVTLRYGYSADPICGVSGHEDSREPKNQQQFHSDAHENAGIDAPHHKLAEAKDGEQTVG